MKLELDEAENLANLLYLNDITPLMKILYTIEDKMGKDVLSYSLDSGKEGLAIVKARYEGAIKMRTHFEKEIKAFKKKVARNG